MANTISPSLNFAVEPFLAPAALAMIVYNTAQYRTVKAVQVVQDVCPIKEEAQSTQSQDSCGLACTVENATLRYASLAWTGEKGHLPWPGFTVQVHF